MKKNCLHIAALTIDLDDTLWPVWPAIQGAEQQLHDWLADHAPRMAQTHDVQGLRALRDQVAQERPEWGHDLTAVRLESLRRGLADHGYSTDLAEPAFEVFFSARHEVCFYADVEQVSAKQVGVGKPDARIFRHACATLNLPAAQVLHVGDDLDLDVAGSMAAGLQAVWVRRSDTAHAHRPAPSGVHTVADLLALADALGC